MDNATGYFADRLERAPLLVILRGLDSEGAVARAEACWSAGVELVEVSLSGGSAGNVLEAVCSRAHELGQAAGAGTVTSGDHLRTAARLGAGFFVSPGLDEGLIAAARDAALPILPGVATASEVQRALRLGCTVLKMFPASVLGAGWLEAMSGPFPEARFVATGGITPQNAHEFLARGALAVAMGSALPSDNVGEFLRRLRAARP